MSGALKKGLQLIQDRIERSPVDLQRTFLDERIPLRSA